MTATKATSVWPVQGLTRQQVYNNAPLNSDVGRVLAGNVATLHGHVVGLAYLDEYTPNPAPGAPGHGLKGHDHSGGLFGQPLRRTLAHFDLGEGHDYEPASDVDGNEDDAPIRFSLAATASQTDDAIFAGPFLPMWVPHCDPGTTGAYRRLSVRCLGILTTSTNTQTGDSISVRVKNVTTGATAEISDASITSTASPIIGASTGTSDLLLMEPGALNALVIDRVRLTTTATVAARTVVGYLSSLTLGVYLA